MLDQVGNGLERYMTLLSIRQRVVASNIANLDTPGYKTKDVDFRTELESAQAAAGPQVTEVAGLNLKSDGNNVSLERESRMLAENALRFSLAASLVRAELRAVRSAIQEGKAL
jgi:flagellar basal-body rod protein FlgB